MDKKNSRLHMAFIFDLKKALHNVNHIILQDKLPHHGIRGILYEWFSSYFANGTQTTHIGNDHISSKKSSVAGVPQGSVLGQYFF